MNILTSSSSSPAIPAGVKNLLDEKKGLLLATRLMMDTDKNSRGNTRTSPSFKLERDISESTLEDPTPKDHFPESFVQAKPTEPEWAHEEKISTGSGSGGNSLLRDEIVPSSSIPDNGNGRNKSNNSNNKIKRISGEKRSIDEVLSSSTSASSGNMNANSNGNGGGENSVVTIESLKEEESTSRGEIRIIRNRKSPKQIRTNNNSNHHNTTHLEDADMIQSNGGGK
jgi:hypothetical protein